MLDKRSIIGVIGSHLDRHDDYAGPLGELIADEGYHLLTGGGDGVMTAVAESFTNTHRRSGHSIGIVPVEDQDDLKTLQNYTNPYIEIPILTQLHEKAMRASMPLSRNMVNVLSSDVLVILPGLHGSQTESSMALIYEKPAILFGPDAEFKTFPEEIRIADTIELVKSFLQQTLQDRE
jgi:uncharacterized protein (TIGR00725 family)